MILLPIITLILILFYYFIKNNKRFDIVHLLVLTYLVMGGSALVLDLSGLFPSVFPIAFEPMAYFSLCLFIVFFGFTGFKYKKFSAIKIESIILYRMLETFLIIGGLLATLFFIPFASIALTGNIEENRLTLAVLSGAIGEFGIVNSLFSLVANLFIVAQVCAFLNLVPREGKRNTKRAYILLISSFSYVVYILSYVGRDGVVYWIMSYLFCYLLFRDFVARVELKRLNRFAGLASVIFLFVFYVISIARFSEKDFGTGWQILNYIGMQIRNFNDHYIVNAPLQHGESCFPELIKLMNILGLDIGTNLNKMDLYIFFLDRGVELWVFTTFIGSLMLDFGRIWLLLFLCLFSFLIRIILKKVSKTGIFEFSNILLFVLLYQIVYWGVFYFRQYSAFYYMLFVILLFVSFKASKAIRISVLILKRPTRLRARANVRLPRAVLEGEA